MIRLATDVRTPLESVKFGGEVKGYMSIHLVPAGLAFCVQKTQLPPHVKTLHIMFASCARRQFLTQIDVILFPQKAECLVVSPDSHAISPIFLLA